MGLNVGTIAVRGKPIQEVQSELGLRETENRDEEPESPVVGALLPSGWYQLYFNDGDYPPSQVLEKLSLNAELVFLDVCETAMASSAVSWENGRQKWSITHDSWKGIEHLEISGDSPACLKPISQRLIDQQREKRDADYVFDIPIEVIMELTGFRYDGNPNGYPVSHFTVLERMNRPRKWWHFWG